MFYVSTFRKYYIFSFEKFIIRFIFAINIQYFWTWVPLTITCTFYQYNILYINTQSIYVFNSFLIYYIIKQL